MLFNSVEYLFLFLPIVFIGYFLINKFKFYNVSKLFLLLASLYFYGSYKWDYVYIIITSVLINYGISIAIKKCNVQIQKKIILILGVIGNAFVLIFFKYVNSFIQILSQFNMAHIDAIKIIIPLGISFFMIQQISYLIDCYKGDINDYKLLDYTLFVCFFPQLIAGPIVRHNEMIPQFNNIKNKIINHNNIYIGLFLIVIGLLKKTVLADNYIPFIDYMTQHKIYGDFYISWLLAISKVFQGYFDFSAYCDLALGSAFLFNISLPWNFNSPFQATNIIDFWKRWNMTLIRFLRVYIYRPLCNRNSGTIATYKNILVVFTVMGIWIGFNPMSILYGVSNGICVCINKYWQTYKIKLNKYISQLLTFLTILFTTQFLFSESMADSARIVKSMLSIDATHIKINIENFNFMFMPVPPFMVKLNIILIVFSIIVLFFFKNSNILARKYAKADNIFYTLLLVILFVFATLSITKGSEFIYIAF